MKTCASPPRNPGRKFRKRKSEITKIASDAGLELDSLLANLERELTDAMSQRAVGYRVLNVLKTSEAEANTSEASIDNVVRYEIVRRLGERTTTIAAKGDTELQPGDLVRLVVPQPERAVR